MLDARFCRLVDLFGQPTNGPRSSWQSSGPSFAAAAQRGAMGVTLQPIARA